MVRAYGTDAWAVLGDARDADDLGVFFGATLTAREVTWLLTREFARSAEDIIWRRNKLGLRLSAEEISSLQTWIAAHPETV